MDEWQVQEHSESRWQKFTAEILPVTCQGAFALAQLELVQVTIEIH
jgi:hypothetical protein